MSKKMPTNLMVEDVNRTIVTQSNDPVIRLARSQIERASEVVARAFQDDPLWKHIFPPKIKRASGLSWLTVGAIRYAQRYGEVYTTKSVDSLAVWLSPDNTTMTLGKMLRAGMLTVPLKIGLAALARLINFQIYTDKLHKQSVSAQHWYLLLLGVEPSCQGEGIGTSLIQPAQVRADADGLPCYLETLNEKSIPFYQKHGYNVESEVVLPSGGLHIWALLRESRKKTHVHSR